ncbi:MAG: DUF1569 domain-containing protein [Planctomycetota bacterium]
MAADTKKAFRRQISLANLEELDAELERVRAAHHAGTIRTSGNWSPGQNLGHLAKWMGWYLDGSFPFKAPTLIRFVGGIFKKKIISSPFRPGLKFVPKSGDLGGDPEYAFEDGWDRLQLQLDRLRAGETLACDTPLVGRVTHDEGLMIQLNHCALHLGFIHYDGTPMDADRPG